MLSRYNKITNVWIIFLRTNNDKNIKNVFLGFIHLKVKIKPKIKIKNFNGLN